MTNLTLLLAICTSFVNPFVGTDGIGHTSPAAACPFSLVAAGPDTGNFDGEHCAGYVSGEKTVYGFSQTHVSGAGRISCGDVMILPFKDAFPGVGVPATKRDGTERAEPGFYGVTLGDGTRVEIAAAPHSALYRIRPEGSSRLELLVDLQYGLVAPEDRLPKHVLSAEVSPCADARGIDGRRVAESWVKRDCSFALRFDRAWSAIRELPKSAGEVAPRYVVTFADLPDEGLSVKIGLSTRSVEGARKNLSAEIPAWDFAAVRGHAADSWEELLSRVEAPGIASDEEKTILYTALYHLFLQPADIADVGEKPFYSTFSFWDTYRAAHPLYTILVPERVPGFVDSILRQGEKNGYLPIWPLWGEETQCMIGSHAVPVLVDAALKGLVDRPTAERAFKAIKDTLTAKHEARRKEGWEILDRYGYYPFDLVPSEGVSRTLECAYDDACAARLAEFLGRTGDAAFFRRRSGNWTNVLDRASGFVRGRDSKGNWREPFDPLAIGVGHWRKGDFTEGNAWHYTWQVQHDPKGLVAALGGGESAAAKLERLFTQPSGKVTDETSAVTGYLGQYPHGNEPCHHVPWLFAYAGRGDLATKYVHEIAKRFYRVAPDGLCGNDDCGQMSAWYVFAALGFYPLDPCGGAYVKTEPVLPGLRLHLPNGRTYVAPVRGPDGDDFILTHERLLRGRDEWYRDAKLGLFVHWGLYAIPGAGEWVMNRNGMSAEDYAKLVDRWNPERGCEERMVQAASRFGAKYMVFTARHHDGFSLFDSRANAFNSMNSPAKRDHVRAYVEACRKHGVRVGLYYSLGDWRLKDTDRAAMKRQAWDELEQLMTEYGKIDLLWYDGGGGTMGIGKSETVAGFWDAERLNAKVRRLQPGILLNDRAGIAGDFRTIEGRNIPRPPQGPGSRLWESCLTLQDDDWSFWGYCRHTAFRKTPEQIVCQLVHCLELGGNLLVNVGPDGTGAIDPWQRELMDTVGGWVARHADAVYGTRETSVAARMPLRIGWTGNSCGFFTRKDTDAYCLFLHAWPGGETCFPVFKDRVVSATFEGKPLVVEQDLDRGRLVLKGLPENPPDDICPVVMIRSH